ncbi:MAG: hypothetical protein Q8Q00_09935 [Dehalococcoidia bacterium]|nr:hypothetical protein [Dehalococcoidia bacterium]
MKKVLLSLVTAFMVVGGGCIIATSEDQPSEWLVVSRGGSLIATELSGIEQEIASSAEQVRFAGTLVSDEGHWVYYLDMSRQQPTLWKYNLETGEEDTVLSTELEPFSGGDLAISPDGRYLVIPGGENVRLFDFEEAASTIVLTADDVLEFLGSTASFDSSSVTFHSATWLPDSKGFQIDGGREGGGFKAVAALVGDRWQLGALPAGWDWLPEGNLSCWAQGGPNPPVMYQVSIHKDPQPSPPLISVAVPGTDCVWLDSKNVAFTVPMADPSLSPITLPSVTAELLSKDKGLQRIEASIPSVALLESNTGEVTILAPLLSKQEASEALATSQRGIWLGLQLVGLPDNQGVVTFGSDLQPLFITLDGDVKPILHRGDQILAVVPVR